MDGRAIVLVVMAASASAAFIVYSVANAMVRLKQAQTPLLAADIEARLARIETAVEAVALEVERAGEVRRFNASLNAPPPSVDVGRMARHTTPV